MPIVTLTTDWGIRDFYAGAFKGALLRAAEKGILTGSRAIRLELVAIFLWNGRGGRGDGSGARDFPAAARTAKKNPFRAGLRWPWRAGFFFQGFG